MWELEKGSCFLIKLKANILTKDASLPWEDMRVCDSDNWLIVVIQCFLVPLVILQDMKEASGKAGVLQTQYGGVVIPQVMFEDSFSFHRVIKVEKYPQGHGVQLLIQQHRVHH